MNNIKILDCTLRDGGYINQWKFGYKNICEIIKNLSDAKIDFVECGFLKQISYDKDKSIFSSVEDLEKIVFGLNSNYLLMINFGEVKIDYIQKPKNDNVMLRVVFKKEQRYEALEYCKKLVQKGLKVFINPMHTNSYNSKELLELIEEVNKINPFGFSIVDTTGAMKERDILSLFYLIDNNLKSNISLCFHSHNNLQLSFSNAQCLMKNCKNRDLIIDSTVFGMGRGAGNLCSELLVQYVNDIYSKKYDIVPILKIADEQINSIFARTPWGYSIPYYLAALNHCHPNYAKFLVDKQTVPVEIINNLLQKIPVYKKAGYDSELIKQIYLDNFSNVVDDENEKQYLKNLLENKTILILAPGKSLINEKEKIEDFILKNNTVVFSLNFISKDYKAQIAFFTNLKRFSSLDKYSEEIFVTSNIEKVPKNAKILNYSSYLNNSKMFDNAALMLLDLLVKLNIKSVNFAGLDGFSPIPSENYFTDELINNAKLNEFDERNKIMREEIERKTKEIQINSLTKSFYFD